MITERGGTGKGGSILVITKNAKCISMFDDRIVLPCVPTAGGAFGGASRITRGGN